MHGEKQSRVRGSLFLIVAFLSFFASTANGQITNLRFKHLGIADGLSQSSAYCLFQDSKGFVWIGTTDGLSRYDGYEFRHFKYDQDNPHSISSNELLCMAEDSTGGLLVGTAVGLDRFDPNKEQFEAVFRADDRSKKRIGFVGTLFKDSRGNIWVGSQSGLMQYDSHLHTLRRVALSPAELGHAGYIESVPAISEDKKHVLWFGNGNSIVRYDPVAGHMLPLPEALLVNPYFNKSRISSIKHDSAGNVWIGTERDGLLVLRDQNRRCVNYRSESHPTPLSNDMIRAICFYKGQAWIGNRNGVYLINDSGKIEKHLIVDKYDPVSLSGNSVLCFMEDNAGSLWVGTFAGGISIDQPGNDNFSYIREQLTNRPGLNYRVVSSIVENKDHNLWIGTEGGGLNFYDRRNERFEYIHVNPASPHMANQEIVKAIQLDAKENVWIGTLEGLFYYNRTSRSVKAYPLAETAKDLLDEQVYGLAKDSGGIWIGTKGGLFYINHAGSVARFRHSRKDSGSIISNTINVLIKDRQDGIWTGTESGLSYLPKGAIHFINYLGQQASVFNGSAVLAIYEDDDSNIWIGTRGGGLKLLDRPHKKFFTIDTKNGLADNTVHGIIEDKQGHLWVSYSQGIARITLKRKSSSFSPDDVQVTNYPVNNGLGSNEFLAATCRTAAGEMMFGGVNGIVSFQPEKLVVNLVPPAVVLTDLLIKNKPVTIDSNKSPLTKSVTYSEGVTLSHDQAYFTLRFAALNFINSRTNQYAYMMEGLKGDKQWYYVGNQQSATYTNLDAGDYVFKVKAANNDGVWNDSYASLRIRVLPPFWRTWWAWLFYCCVIAALLYLFYSYSIRTARLQNDLQMQRISREKDQELMQRKLSFFTNISHEIKTPLTLILAPIEKLISLIHHDGKALDQLRLMQRNGERLLRLTNQLLDFRKLEAGNLQLQVTEGDLIPFVRDILQSFDAYAHHCDIDLTLVADAESMPVWFDPDKLEKILFNLLSNAIKFTQPGGRVVITLKMMEDSMEPVMRRYMIIMVEDNGAGIAAKNLERIFYPFHHYNDTDQPVDGTGIGLAFTRGLVSMHHGTITVDSRQADTISAEEGYTRFTITIPSERNQYLDEEFQAAGNDPEKLPDPGLSPALGKWGGLPPDNKEHEPGVKPAMLLVEDNMEVLAFMKAHFEDAFTVHAAANGTQGWDYAIRIIPDIIISDVMMPEISGTELCRRLKQDTRTSHIPVILLTARSPLVFQLEGFETGADDYITKPFSLALLQVRVSNLLASRRLLRERYSKDITLQPSNIAITPADELFFGKLMAFIEDNMMEPTLNVEQLGREVGMSRITFYRKIKALTNQSPIEFIRGVRLKKAAQLLRSREFTVNEVAYMVGFSDVDYFRKWFKQEFGSTPKEYAAGHSDKE
jgi:signal transduction histidine kinase/ligand-binding sensor domain-containing protein/CheY-like chemotaxis protein/AraC-like DNA-binding protein